MFYKSLQSWAVDENWTRDLFLTKEVLYHWATTARMDFINQFRFYTPLWSGRRDSNPRPSAWKANALSTELLPQINLKIWRFENLKMNLQIFNFFNFQICCGQWRIRTSEVERQLSYSQPQLATLVTAQNHFFLFFNSQFIMHNCSTFGYYALWILHYELFLSLLSDSNQRPRDYKSRALANWAKEAKYFLSALYRVKSRLNTAIQTACKCTKLFWTTKHFYDYFIFWSFFPCVCGFVSPGHLP